MTPLEVAKNSKNPAHIGSVQRAIIVIELLSQEEQEISLTNLAQKLGWPKSTTHGILTTLRDFNFADQSEETGHYSLGVRFFELGSNMGRRWDIKKIAKPIMKRLSEELGETVHLGKAYHGEVLYLEKIEPSNLLRIVSGVGSRLPMHCSALGKVLLAYITESEVERILVEHGMQSFTKYTKTTPGELKEELQQVRKQGYAIDDNEIMDGLKCIGFPIFDDSKCAPYAISVSALSNHLQGYKLDVAKVKLRQAAEDISRKLYNLSS